MAQKDIILKGRQELEHEDTQADIIRPAVDIFEAKQGLTLVADMPGVAKEDLSIDIDKGFLTIRGQAKSKLTGEQLSQEFLPGNYYRQFHVPNEIDASSISAEMDNGVLTLHLPKTEAAKPRRIEIT